MAVTATRAAQGAQYVDSSDAAFDSAGIAVRETWRGTARSCELLRLSRVPPPSAIPFGRRTGAANLPAQQPGSFPGGATI